MDKQQRIRQVLAQRQIKAVARKVISRTERPKKPAKVIKTVSQSNPVTLIEAPSATGSFSVVYPTPEWFAYKGNAEVSVIIPVYKSQGVLDDLIDNWPLEEGVELIFVDDYCPNNSKDVVIRAWSRRNGKNIGKIIYNTVNKGYGGACNVGAEHASGKYLIFLNADTKVTIGWIQPIVEVLKDVKVGIVGNLQIKQGGVWDGTIDSAGSEWTWAASCFVHIGRHSHHKQNIPAPYKPENAPKDILSVSEREMVTGCCLGISKNLFQYVGGFNPNYRIGYWEDADLCLTIRELGYKVIFQPNSRIYHKLSHTGSGGHQYQDNNRNFFFNKWVSSQRIDDLVDDKRTKQDIRTVLLKRTGAFGDVLVAAAIAPALKKKYPNCKVIFCTECKEVVKDNPYIDKVIDNTEFSERLFQVYYNLDMAYEFRPYANILSVYAETVGVKKEDCKLFLATKPIDIPEDYVVIHPGRTSWVGRNWGSWAKVAEKLLNEGQKVICVGNAVEEIPCTIDLRGKTSISQLAYVISKARMFCGIDSFPMHVAQVFDVPGLCFFGSILPETRIFSKNMRAVSANIPCLGCHHRKPTPCVVTNICEMGNQDCIKLVTPEVFNEKIKISL